MPHVLTCPSCGAHDLDLCAYESMMVLRSDIALFTLKCKYCANRVSSLQPIPECLRDEVRFVAREIGAGMGASNSK